MVLSPVLVGAALAWHEGAAFAWVALGLSLLGASALHLAANAFNDVYDERSGADKMAVIDRAAITTASGVLEQKLMTQREMLRLAIAMLGVAAVCGLALALSSRGGALLVLGALGALLGWQYVAPPVRYGYRGLGEIGIFLCYGPLPVIGSYYVQTGRYTADAAWASVVPGLLTTMVLYHHNFLHWRADKAAHKMTPIVLLEPQLGIIASAFILTAAYLVLVAQVAVGLFPPAALLVLITMLPVGAGWARVARDPSLPQHALMLLAATLASSVLTGLVLTVSLIATR